MNAMPTPTVTSELAPEPLSQVSRIVNTFIAPSKTFNDLRRSASWWAPFLLMAIVSVIFAYSMDRNVGFDQVAKTELAKVPSQAEQVDKLPPDQKAQNMRVRTAFTRYISYGIPVIIPVAFVIMAAVLMATFNFGAGASVPFKVALAIVAYGGLPGILHALLGSISLFAGGISGSLDKEAFNINNPVATNPAYWMDPMGNKFAYGMATAFDVFIIWNIVLVGIGFACNSKVKRGTAIAIVAGWYLLWKLVTSGLAAAFS
jgi:Yip1 domain